MPRKEVRRDSRVGGEMTRVTIVGAILIVILGLVVLVTIDALIEKNKPDLRSEGE